MPEFAYKALRSDGSMVEGNIAAKDRGDANRKLANAGVQPFQVHESGKAPAAKPKKAAAPAPKAKASGKKAANAATQLRLTSTQVIFFTEELSDLLSAGVQLEPALKMMEGRGGAGPVRLVTTKIREQVRDGVSLSRAMAAASPSFGSLYCNLVAAGEAGGALSDILKRQIRYLTTMAELRSKVVTAMIYPAFLFFVGALVTVFFVSFLMPRLIKLVESNGGEVPLIIQILIGVSAFLKVWWWLLLIGIAVAVVVFLSITRNPRYRPGWDRIKLKFPLFGNLQLRRFHVQFLETLSNLLGNGMSLIRSLQLCQGSAQNLYLESHIARVGEQVSDGASLHRCLEKTGVFPTTLIDMIRVGEQTGQLTESLAKAGDRLDRDLNRSVERISAFIQPVIIILMAGVVGTMALLMVSVIQDTINMLQTR